MSEQLVKVKLNSRWEQAMENMTKIQKKDI